MHPAFSVILFTTASGAGYGLLALLGVLGPAGLLPADRWFGLIAFTLAFLPITFGLLASTFHLGHPERAWRAMSQWRSSWLSREGLLAVVTYIPAGLFALGWVGFEHSDGIWGWFGIIAAMLSAATVYATAMIYRSLKPIQRWCNAWVVPSFLLLGLMTGALLLHALLALYDRAPLGVTLLALAATVIAGVTKKRYWRFIDTTQSVGTAGSATGLGHLGRVRLLEAPHTGENYLMREMGFRVARKHAVKLRRIATLLAFSLPAIELVIVALFGDGTAVVASPIAAVSALIGVAVERWLFFAEAKHAVTLYYGAESA
jgi:DMSO reductase anchor subunit